MKKSMIMAVVMTASIGLLAGSAVFAEEGMGMMSGKSKDGKAMMMGKEGMKGCMMQGMMNKTVTATSDGGVVVNAGSQLFKYDAKLNLVNQAKIPVDREMMREDMTATMKMCPMMKSTGGMMGADDMAASAAFDSGSTGTKPDDKNDHAAHH